MRIDLATPLWWFADGKKAPTVSTLFEMMGAYRYDGSGPCVVFTAEVEAQAYGRERAKEYAAKLRAAADEWEREA